VAEAVTEALDDQEDVIIESMSNMLAAGFPYGPNEVWTKKKWLQEEWEKERRSRGD